MASLRKKRIIPIALAIFAAAVLFVTYGTVLPTAPFAPVRLDEPMRVDSDGSMTVIADTGSRRALILNADNDLTGVVGCTTIDSPIDAITDACVSDGLIYLSGVRFEPDSDVIKQERVAVYDKGGNYQSVIFEIPGAEDTAPSIKSLNDVPNGVVVIYESRANPSDKTSSGEGAGGDDKADYFEPSSATMKLAFFNGDEKHELEMVDSGNGTVHDAAYSVGREKNYYATLSTRGLLDDNVSDYDARAYSGRVFTAIDIGEDGTLYACDNETGALFASPPGSSEMRMLVEGDGYFSVHENDGILSICDNKANAVKLCDASGTVKSSFSEVKPSLGFSARMMLVWASGLYLVALVLFLFVREVRRRVAEGRTENFGPIFLSVAVVAAIAIAFGGLSYSSYRSGLELRAREINACADYVQLCAPKLSEAMQRADNRNALSGGKEQLSKAVVSIIEASEPALMLVHAANTNGIGMYFTLYGRDEQGAFYLYGSSSEHVMGASTRSSGTSGLDKAFELDFPQKNKVFEGQTLRGAAQYRFVQILSPDEKSVAGVIEIGSKRRSLEASLMGSLAQRVLALLVLVLAIYLAYCEIRACGRCLFEYRQRRAEAPIGAVAVLTRPFTLAITMLMSIDSVMTVLIARDLLERAGMGGSNQLLALPSVMLGVGLVVSQALYGFVGSRMGLRRLMASGAVAMLLCACFTAAAVFMGHFWFYCAAKLFMSMACGMLYALGYSLQRLADDDETRTLAAGGVRRTDTSAVALGTVLGGYAAQTFGNAWVYVLVALVCVPVAIMALSLLPRGMKPLEALAQPDGGTTRVFDFVKSPAALTIAFFIVLPATIAAGYASFLFPLFSADLGLAKSDINNIVVIGQLVVYVCISRIDSVEKRYGKQRVTVTAVALLGVVFLLFAFNTTLAWSVGVIILVAFFCKCAVGWRAMWLQSADEAGVPAGGATGAMFATRSLALMIQPTVLGLLLGVVDYVAVLLIGAFCLACAGMLGLIMWCRQRSSQKS